MKQSQEQVARTMSGMVSRRAALRGIGGVGIATALGAGAFSAGAAQHDVVTASPIEPNAGSWKTWWLASGDQFRPAGPPDLEAARAEFNNVRTILAGLRAVNDITVLDHIAYWDAGAPGYRWNEIATKHTITGKQISGAAYRTMALVNVAIHDASRDVIGRLCHLNREPRLADPARPGQGEQSHIVASEQRMNGGDLPLTPNEAGQRKWQIRCPLHDRSGVQRRRLLWRLAWHGRHERPRIPGGLCEFMLMMRRGKGDVNAFQVSGTFDHGTTQSLVDLATMTDFDDKDGHGGVRDQANGSIVANPVSPETAEVARQRLPS